MDEGDARRAVRIVFHRGNTPWYAIFVALEIDDPVLSLVTAALVADGDLALRVAAGFFRETDEPNQELLIYAGNFPKLHARLTSPSPAQYCDSRLEPAQFPPLSKVRT
jgi:hypothetical protein